MDKPKKILSNYNIYTKYAKWIPSENRRESWDEVCDRNMNMHLDKFEHLGKEFAQEIVSVYDN